MAFHLRGRWISAAIVTAFLAGLAVFAGCGDDNPEEPPTSFAPPTNLTMVNGSGRIDLSWQATPDAGLSDFKGYNVYRSDSSMVGASASQLRTHLRTATPITPTTYTDQPVTNAHKYYYAVRAVHGDSELSTATNEVDTAARFEEMAEVLLAEFAYADQPSGLETETAQAYAMESAPPHDNRSHVDVYLGTTGPNDEAGGDRPLVLKSPHLVLDQAPAWDARRSELMLIGTGQSAWDLPSPLTTGTWSASIILGATSSEVVDKVIAIRTPVVNGKRHYAKVWILSMTGTPGERSIGVAVAWQGLEDYPRFVRQL